MNTKLAVTAAVPASQAHLSGVSVAIFRDLVVICFIFCS